MIAEIRLLCSVIVNNFRQVIRDQLGYGIQQKIKELPLPMPIMKFLNLPELDEIPIEKAQMNTNVQGSMALAMQEMPPCGLWGLQGTLSYDYYHEMLR